METMTQRFKRLDNYNSLDKHQEAIDIRGFKVVTDNDVEIGKVNAVIVDEASDSIRYIEVNTKDHLDSPINDRNGYRNDDRYRDRFEGGAHYMLIPAGLISVDKDTYTVTAKNMIAENLYTGPRHQKDDDFDAAYEYAVVDKYVNTKGSDFLEKYGKFRNTKEARIDNHFYERDYFTTRRDKRGQPSSPVL
ncbi:PRC-barrel domain-containing protein [Portibacter marinus]|uniref:PRC-barrel domain-containing protein n=1 Tax=Portibacter marinus TaxID=2898660 RepID=UPI001F16A5E7|nr:PRC-barrel domain-containing protein [Portibacter marinus]